MSYQQHQQANDDNLAIKTLDSQDLESLCPLDNDRHDFDLSANSPDLGNLELSLELTELIIKHLDIPSLTTFRRVSKRAMHMVDSTFEYAQIMNRAPQIIRGALILDACGFTLNDAYITLNDETCATCVHQGRFIYMITCERVCVRCLIRYKRWRPFGNLDMHVERDDLARVPSAMARPGTYGMPRRGPIDSASKNPLVKFMWERYERRVRLWDEEHCREKRLMERLEHMSVPWYHGQFSVSVRAPLANGEEQDIDERDFCQKYVRALPLASRTAWSHSLGPWFDETLEEML